MLNLIALILYVPSDQAVRDQTRLPVIRLPSTFTASKKQISGWAPLRIEANCNKKKNGKQRREEGGWWVVLCGLALLDFLLANPHEA